MKYNALVKAALEHNAPSKRLEKKQDRAQDPENSLRHLVSSRRAPVQVFGAAVIECRCLELNR